MREFGVNVWWTVPEFTVSAKVAQESLMRNGFEKEDMPLPSRRGVVSRAAYSFQDRRHKNGRKVTEKAKDNSECVVYGILSRTSKGDEEVAYDQGTTIKLEKESGRVTAEGFLSDDFHERLSHYSDSYTDEDVRNFLRRVVKMCFGIAKRPTGGIYFVPERCAGIIESASRVLEELNVGARVYVERIMNGEQERSIVWEAVESDIASQIEQTLNAVERIEKRVSSVKNHEDKLNQLEELMDIYRGLLGEEAKYEDLVERFEDASNKVASKMGELQNQINPKSKKKKKKLKDFKTGSVGKQAIDMAAEVLKEAGCPLHYREIADKAQSKGLELRGKDGGAWMNSWISETFRDGRKSPFKRVGKGYYEYS